jgi:hypothetical protein
MVKFNPVTWLSGTPSTAQLVGDIVFIAESPGYVIQVCNYTSLQL